MAPAQPRSQLTEGSVLPEGTRRRFARISRGQVARERYDARPIHGITQEAASGSMANHHSSKQSRPGKIQTSHAARLAAHAATGVAAEPAAGRAGGIKTERRIHDCERQNKVAWSRGQPCRGV